MDKEQKLDRLISDLWEFGGLDSKKFRQQAAPLIEAHVREQMQEAATLLFGWRVMNVTVKRPTMAHQTLASETDKLLQTMRPK